MVRGSDVFASVFSLAFSAIPVHGAVVVAAEPAVVAAAAVFAAAAVADVAAAAPATAALPVAEFGAFQTKLRALSVMMGAPGEPKCPARLP